MFGDAFTQREDDIKAVCLDISSYPSGQKQKGEKDMQFGMIQWT